jgi:AcrR family transcriptional regulator
VNHSVHVPLGTGEGKSEAKERLLAACIDHLGAHGVGDISLRRLAAAIGTSHRMLIYHFGSKDGLLVEVVRAVEERQRRVLTEIWTDLGPDADPARLMRGLWARLTDPALAPYERLFFELYGRALRDDPQTAPLLEGLVDTWLDTTLDLLAHDTTPTDDAKALARLGIAVVRGLLLDFLATGDKPAVDAAMEMFIAAYRQQD